MPLAILAVQHGERVALSMDSRGFSAYPRRTELQHTPWQVRDWCLVASFGSYCVAVVVAPMNVSKDSTRQEPDVSISVAALIRPAKGAMVLSAVLTALGAIVTLVPFVALHNMAAIWLDGQVRTGCTGKPWVWP